MQFRSVKGMNDLLPAELNAWHRLEEAFKRHVALYGFSEIRPPIVEHKELFVRSIGEVTDVVQKEMYTISRGDEELALRPEGTVGCARAYLEHSVHGKEPTTRWYYVGPMFRAERPQRGRYRQFYQAGCEVYGDAGPMVDAELLAMLVGLFSELGVAPLTVKINSVGSTESRARYRELLVAYLTPLEAELSETSRERLGRNPLRILDSKNPRDQELLQGAPSTLSALTEDDRAHFESFCSLLEAFSVPYVVDTKLVRGLDYYTRTVFEITTEAGQVGSQNAIVAGGRYDRMLEELGGPSLPAFGFAMGLERVLLALGPTEIQPPLGCAVIALGHRAGPAAAQLATALRSSGIRVDLDGRDNSLKSKLRRTNSMGIPLALLLGDSEVERGVVQVKNLARGTQSECPLAEALAEVQVQLTNLADPGQKPTPQVSEPQV
jgi:histidyl-tRNA synthetase